MKKLLALALLALSLGSANAQTTINNLGAGRGSVIGADLFPSYQGANPAVRPSATQIAAYVYGLASGDLTVNGTGTHTFATVNSNVGTFGSTANCTTITVNAKGLITAASQAACAPPFSAVTGRTTLVQLPQGSANSIWINPTGSTADMQNLAVPACANDGAHALVYVNGSGLVCATITAGTGTVTSVGASCGNVAAPNPITTSGTIDAGIAIRTATGTTDTVLAADCGNLVNYTNAGSVAVTLPQAGTAGFATRAFFQFCSQGAGTTTITPTTSTIGGATTKTLTGGTAAAPVCTGVVSDGTNYQLVPSSGGGGGGTPGGSSGQIQYNNAGAFGGFTQAGDCTTVVPNIRCNLPNSGIVSNRWYQAFTGNGTQAFGGTGGSNQIACRFVVIPRLVTIKALGFYNNNVGTTNVQMAIYANDITTGRPAALIGNTGNVSNTTTGSHSGAMAANKQVGPGGSDGGREVWFCSNMGDNTATYGVVYNLTNGQSVMIGSNTLNEVLQPNDQTVGVVCSGAACNGGSSTLGTWPATLAGSTWSSEQPGSTGVYSPVIAYQAN